MGVEPEDGELGAIGQAELVQYRADAIADRAFAQEQSGGDVAVIEALGDQRGDLTFALAKQALDGIGGISGIYDWSANVVRNSMRAAGSVARISRAASKPLVPGI